MVERFTSPAWGLDVKCGKGSDFSYGPWADRQRDFLFNFFFPSDYQKAAVAPAPQLGQLRTFETFDFRLSTLADATIDLLFVNATKETSAMHVNAGPGSYLEVTIPWVTKSTGYESHILGQILHLDATTSLTFRALAESETLEFDIRIKYPMTWNGHQEWLMDLIGSKASVSLIFQHKAFFCDLIDDWAGKGRPDIVTFVPYTVKLGLVLKEFELVVKANEHNWIDCSSNTSSDSDNVQLAIIGDTFDMSFDLPFGHFLPLKVPIKIWIQGESLEAAFYLPLANAQRDIVQVIHATAKLGPLKGNAAPGLKLPSVLSTEDLYPSGKKWRNLAKAPGWTTCWSVPIIALSINYDYHTMSPQSNVPRDADVTTPEREELLLEPMKPGHVSAFTAKRATAPADFDPGAMPGDTVHVELEVGPSTLCLYGVVLRMLWDIKENYLGESQQFTDFAASPGAGAGQEADKPHPPLPTSVVSFALPLDGRPQQPLRPFDARLYRPLNVTVSVTMHDIHGHLMKACGDQDPVVPSVYLERLAFEMDKKYTETKLQLLLSPAMLWSSDLESRPLTSAHLKDGFLVLESLQFRGHAMFSGIGRGLESETLEYGWLVEVAAGQVGGRLTLPQLAHVVTSLETLLLQVTQAESALQPPAPYQKCLHDLIQSACPDSDVNMAKLCPNSEQLKYRMVRLEVARLDLCKSPFDP